LRRGPWLDVRGHGHIVVRGARGEGEGGGGHMGPRTHRAVRRRAPTPGFGGDIPHTEQTRGPNGGERGADLYSRGVRPGGGGGGGHVCAHIYKQRDTYGGRSLRWRAHGAMEGCPETQTAPGHHYIYGGARDSRERGDTLTGVKWNINVAEGGERNTGYHYGGMRGTGERGGGTHLQRRRIVEGRAYGSPKSPKKHNAARGIHCALSIPSGTRGGRGW